MYARSFCRAAQQPLKRSVQRRGYASENSQSSGGMGMAGYTAIGALLAGGGYYYYANYLGKATPIPNPAKKLSSEPAPKAFTGGEQGFLSLKLAKVEDINHNTKKFIFSLPEKDQVSGLPVASALLTKFQNEGMEKPVLRPYTPVSDVDHQGEMELIVKRYPNGPMSEHIFSLKPGQTLDIKGPLPKYPITPNKHNHIGMIAGGTGITPMWQVLRAIFKNPEDKTKVTLIYGNLTEEDIILRKELNELENTYPQRFRVYYMLDKPPANWTQGSGYITKDLVQTLIPEAKEENNKVLVCGPPGLYKAVSGMKQSPQDQGELSGVLKELGFTKDQVFKF